MFDKSFFRSMLGALVGDAAGATLEFMDHVTPEMARAAMKMPGGGPLNVGPGQITDDGELTLAAWQHLQSCNDAPTHHLIRAYSEWYKSRPFDVGITCAYAFSEACSCIPKDPTGPLYTDEMHTYMKHVKENNIKSEANGALMRASALATWFITTNAPSIHLAIGIGEADARLSHPSVVCREVNKVYVLALVSLLHGFSPQDTLQIVTDYVDHYITSEDVKEWFYEFSLDINSLDCKVNIGHVKYAFVLAIYFLRNPDISYEEAIYRTLIKGGDTDTNACIVGGLVACYQPIPDYMANPVLEFDCTVEGLIRPPQYSVKRVLNTEKN
jgi:ADP-ribosyl-[dinitrogen reductase] hydrolase